MALHLSDLQELYSFSPDFHLPDLQDGFGKMEGEASKAGGSTLSLVPLGE